jgi:4-oxalocrotonate tautomerase family enzyme
MPIVRIETWPIPREAKDTMIARVTDAVVESVGCPSEAVQVLLYEVDKADWATAGVCHAERSPMGEPPFLP